MLNNVFAKIPIKYLAVSVLALLSICLSCAVDTLTYEGTVQNVDVQAGTFTLLTSNTAATITFKINSGTKINLGGKSATLAAMQIGSDVIANVDRSDNKMISVSDRQPAIISPTPSP